MNCDERFLAVEKDEFDLRGERGIEGEDAREFEQRAGAGSAVVRADEADRAEALGVVVRADDGALGVARRRAGAARRKNGR